MAVEGVFSKYGGLVGYRDTKTGKVTPVGGSSSSSKTSTSSSKSSTSSSKTSTSSSKSSSTSSRSSTSGSSSRSSGGSSGGSSSYSKYVSYFGSPEAYAKAIQEKLSSGQQLTDRTAALEFMSARPDLFRTTTSSSGGGTASIRAITPPSGSTPETFAPWNYGEYWGQGDTSDVIGFTYEGEPIHRSSVTAPMQSEIDQLRQELINMRQNQLPAWPTYHPSFPSFGGGGTMPTQPVQPVQPPETISEAPALVGQKPAEQPATPGADVQRDILEKGPGGFVLPAVSPLGTVPAVDQLYDIYRQVFGKEDEQARQYLASPQFQGILQSGRIPMWMSADPLWRLYFQRLGINVPGISEEMRNARARALRERLAG